MTGPTAGLPNLGGAGGITGGITGRPVLLVRPDHNDSDAVALREVGFTVLVEPYLQVTTAQDPVPARGLLAMLDPGCTGHHTWLVLTSPRTMTHWAALVRPDVLDSALRTASHSGLRVACVGSATAATLPAGLASAISATAPNASALLADLLTTTAAPARSPAGGASVPAESRTANRMLALLPGSAIAQPTLPAGLAASGWAVRSAVVYDTRPVPTRPASADLLDNGTAAALILRSPSAVAAVARFVTPAPSVAILTVGPTTTSAARERGWSSITSASPDPMDVARALTHALTGDR